MLFNIKPESLTHFENVFVDFTRSVVMEGCEPLTFSHPDKFLSLAETSDLGNIRSGHGVHLTGGASLYPFVSYFVKNVFVNPSVLPINYFSVGRQYISVNPADTFSLFRAQQSTAVQCFSVSQSSGSMMEQFDHLTDLLRKFYDGLGLHYRLGKFLQPQNVLFDGSFVLTYKATSDLKE